jgi:hypothetical protein
MAKRDSVAVAESETIASGFSAMVTGPLSASTVTGNAGAAAVSVAADDVAGAAAGPSFPPHATTARASRTAARAARGRLSTFPPSARGTGLGERQVF